MAYSRLAAIALLSGAALAYELLLIRWLSIAQWYPFASLVISLALLGHGVAGTALSLAGARLRSRFHGLFPVAALAFALTALLGTLLAQRTGFNGLAIVWEPTQLLRLMALYAILTVPFCCAAACFGLAFVQAPRAAPAIYAADLCGAGAGAAGVMLGLLWLPPTWGLKLIVIAGGLAAALAAGRRRVWLAAVLGGAVVAALPDAWLAPRISPFKGLPALLNVQGAELVAQRHSPYGDLAVVRNDVVPPRIAPGLSLSATAGPDSQLAVSVDGDATHPITAPGDTAFLRAMLDAAPYTVLAEPRVLILGAGGGLSTLQALVLGAASVTSVELNPAMTNLVVDDYAEFAGHLYQDPRVIVSAGDPRGFIRRSGDDFDLIRLGSADSLAAAGAGVGAAAEAYGLTVEAFGDYYAHLTDRGVLAVLRWAKLPPRDVLKLCATAIEALRRQGRTEPGAHLAVLRNWDTTLMLVRRNPWPAPALERLRAFAERHAFDLAWLPNLQLDELNRFHRLPEPQVHAGITALLGPDAASFLDRYKFELRPATDDRPFFHHFFKWHVLPELLSLREQGGGVLLDSGYLVQVGGLVQAVLLSVLLIGLPLAVLRRRAGGTVPWRPALYFGALGLAFLFIEIACIQRFTLILGHPLLAAAGVITTFLLAAGVGSALAQRLVATGAAARAMPAVIGGIGLSGVLLILGFPLLERAGATLLAGVTVVPLALLMGMPFPLGMARLGAENPSYIPWAWGINGCTSVLSALLAGLFAVHIGYTALIALALLLYIAVLWAWPPRAAVSV